MLNTDVYSTLLIMYGEINNYPFLIGGLAILIIRWVHDWLLPKLECVK